ncbi:hypothetical protein N7486_002439 [Penicillium sp. IBT 16267x]|nr:hypothetical protein N7486_002439 [Penicillium sp. IBT 16267x]
MAPLNHDPQDQLTNQPQRETRTASRDIVGDISSRNIVSGSQAINRVISYLYHTRFHALTYRPRRSEEDEAVALFSDASFADNSDRKSSKGYICTIFGGPVDWRAGKQRTVTTSITEAELLAISEAARTISMWKRLFKAIRFDPKHELTIRCDNQQTIRLLTKEAPQLRTKLRYVDIHHHWLRQEVQVGRILIKWTETKDMAADGLTSYYRARSTQNLFK